MLDRYGDDLMYVPELAQWYVWTGKYWKKAEQVEIENLAKETIRSLMDEVKTIADDQEKTNFLKFCVSSQKASMVRNIVTLIQSDPKITVSADDIDRHSHLLGVSNGVVDLRTGELMPPDKKYRITIITNVEYDKNAKAPLFEQTVSDAFFGDEEMVAFFQRLIGYSLLGKPNESIVVIPYGLGANGKSTLLGAIRDVLGRHARTASPETFLSTSSKGGAGAAREDILRLRGARFVYVSEPDEGSELKEGLIKAMTGGEPLPARGLYAKSTVEITPTWVVFMPTNHKPIIKGDDYAIWRRIMLIPFTRDFDHDPIIEKDKRRSEKLISEAKGILAWCIKGAIEYHEKGLCPPAGMREAVDEYRSDMDLLRDWIDECCETGADYVETTARLWMSWESYARSRGELRYIQSAKALGKRLSSKGFKPVKNIGEKRARGFAGIRIARGPEGDF
jgi:P4 family phage/plasmid primase-like protien